MNRTFLTVCLLWLVCAIFLSSYSLIALNNELHRQLRPQLAAHLQQIIDKRLFSNHQGRVNDQRAILAVASAFNRQAGKLTLNLLGWQTAQCDIELLSIDAIAVTKPSTEAVILNTQINVNKLSRPVQAGIHCIHQPALHGIWALLLLPVFIVLYRWLPQPLTAHQRHWLNYLMQRGDSEATATARLAGINDRALELSPVQQQCFEQLFVASDDFNDALDRANDDRLNRLDARQTHWLLKALDDDPADIDHALQVATAADTVVIDLPGNSLRIRSHPVPLTKTLLLYYAWYAQARSSSDGWLLNPRSDRPDQAMGKQLATFMAEYEGHGKAIQELEAHGLKARTLDKSRNKIKEAFVQALGTELAALYLFESRKDPATQRTYYRLAADASLITLID